MIIFCSNTCVNAEVYKGNISGDEYIPDAYVKKKKADGSSDYKQFKILRQSTDHAFVYCLQPFVEINNDYTYNVTQEDYETYLNLTDEQWIKISLISYYGYGYTGHTDSKWYAITQVMIWEVAEPSGDYYFTNGLNGTRNDNKYDDERAEINKLVSQHSKVPKFSDKPETLIIGNSVTLEDTNSVISKFKVKTSTNATAKINGNSITIKATGVGDAKIKLAKEDSLYETAPIVYFSPYTQNVLKVGSFDPVYTTINIKIVGGKVELTKKDKDTGEIIPQGMATLEGAVYGIYKSDTNELVGKLTTDGNSFARSDYLPNLGSFYLKELKASVGYQLDPTKYNFTIDEENLLAKIDVFEEVIKRNFEFTKVYASNKTEIMTPEANIQFAIYDHNNKLVSVETTDEEGKIYVVLPYGEYTLKQLTTTSGYEKMEDYHFEVKEMGDTINKVFSNAEITAKIKVIKVDQDDNKITRAGIKFKIKDLKTNEYVCQSVTYPRQETYCEFETDDDGVLITPYPLNSGDYQLEEVDQIIDGYTWNSQPLKFSINENSNILTDDDLGAIIELKFTNQEVKGVIEIHKKGEKLIIDDDKFTYEEIPLPNVTYGLYNLNGELIREYTTDNNGYIKIEDLKLGKYLLKETRTTDDHVLDETIHEVNLVYKDQYTPIVSLNYSFKNYLKKGKLKFTKTDFVTGDPLPNTKIQIYSYVDNEDDATLIFEGITDKNGNIIIDNLFVGKYYIIEKEAPKGYILNPDKMYFEIKSNGEVVVANMTNDQIVEVPDTYISDSHIKDIIAFSFFAIGIGILVYDKKKNKK